MRKQNRKPNTSALDELYEAVLCLESKEECEAFFDALCTVQELQTLSQRLQVAKMLRNHHVYHDIVETTGASTATISRVNRSLGNGYEVVFSRLQKKPKNSNSGAEPEDI